MNSLEAQYPRLKTFCQMNWEEVSKEYETHYIDISFPEYLQQKASEGDCPDYLFELAFYEMAMTQVLEQKITYPYLPGVYLNPSCLFLSLEYDILSMIKLAETDGPNLIERSNYLCVYQNTEGKACVHELTFDELQILQILEDGPALSYKAFAETKPEHLRQLSRLEVVLDLLKT